MATLSIYCTHLDFCKYKFSDFRFHRLWQRYCIHLGGLIVVLCETMGHIRTGGILASYTAIMKRRYGARRIGKGRKAYAPGTRRIVVSRCMRYDFNVAWAVLCSEDLCHDGALYKIERYLGACQSLLLSIGLVMCRPNAVRATVIHTSLARLQTLII